MLHVSAAPELELMQPVHMWVKCEDAMTWWEWVLRGMCAGWGWQVRVGSFASRENAQDQRTPGLEHFDIDFWSTPPAAQVSDGFRQRLCRRPQHLRNVRRARSSALAPHGRWPLGEARATPVPHVELCHTFRLCSRRGVGPCLEALTWATGGPEALLGGPRALLPPTLALADVGEDVIGGPPVNITHW